MRSTTEQNPWIIAGSSGRTKVPVLPSPPPQPLVLVLVLVHLRESQLPVARLLLLEQRRERLPLWAPLDTRRRSSCSPRPVDSVEGYIGEGRLP